MEEFDSFEKKLEGEDYWQQAVAFLCTLGGGRVLHFVKRILEPLSSNHLLAEFNLTGTHHRRDFQRTRSYTLLGGRLHT
ncbi:unnamed protein product [Dibothriocephalus latus]|uniref:Uncharacterized protein n=1 Tax=Dibothriocephalus latus TaxID=60516 RepID=A0A3P7L745_DIBLA|nr:unnamed protein product [Dibothriocephalus latus]